MTEGYLSQQGHFPDRRGADRQISVLINAGIVHQGSDSLCRIRNLSSGGVMIECNLPLSVDDRLSLHLRSGHELGGCVRWVNAGKAGIAFDEPDSAALVSGTRGVSETAPASPIGYPLFRRKAWGKLSAGHERDREQVAVAMISPTGVVVETMRDWPRGHPFTIAIDGLGNHMARLGEAVPGDEGDMLALIFAQPLHYRSFSDWLAVTSPVEEALPFVAELAGNPHWA